MSELESLLAQYDYVLPKERIAQAPASPRDSSKLLIYDRVRDTVSFDTFSNIPTYLPKGALLIFNDTRVIPARLHANLPDGKLVEVMCLSFDEQTRVVRALVNRGMEPGTTLTLEGARFTVLSHETKEYMLRVESTEPIRALLEKFGETPIPPYIKGTPLTETQLREKYQSVFAREEGSVAAPTASLHFTEQLLDQLRASCEMAFVTLHVNLGTFAPLTEKELERGELHTEWYSIPEETLRAIERAKAEGRPVIAVGTTAARALESAFAYQPPRLLGETNIFIREGYEWRCVDGLITNFHVPKSSLLMLVATLTGRERLLALYAEAIANDFRFFSFGDGMLIL